MAEALEGGKESREVLGKTGGGGLVIEEISIKSILKIV